MANGKYDAGLGVIAAGSAPWASATYKVRLVPSTYVFSAAHATMAAVGSGIGTDQPTTSKTVGIDTTNHFAFWKSAANPSWGTLAGGSTIGGAVLFQVVTTDADHVPIAFYDTANLVTTGTDPISLVWPTDALGGVLKLS